MSEPDCTGWPQGRVDTDFRLPLPGDFKPPAKWQTEGCIAVPASPDWVALDYAAVMASRTLLQGLFGPNDSWPPASLTMADDSADLAWHAREFALRRSFAYSRFSPVMQRCLGCLYLYPTASPEHEAEAYLWISGTEPEAVRWRLADKVMDWLRTDWPLCRLAWPGRSIAFSDWPYRNYYAAQRYHNCVED